MRYKPVRLLSDPETEKKIRSNHHMLSVLWSAVSSWPEPYWFSNQSLTRVLDALYVPFRLLRGKDCLTQWALKHITAPTGGWPSQ